MKDKSNQKRQLVPETSTKKSSSLEGYPLYPDNEDIYNNFQKDETVDTDGISRNELTENEKIGANNEKEFDEDFSGDDLDIPGAELDDQQEETGSEDEENNHYSIGGDRHEGIDENLGNEKF